MRLALAHPERVEAIIVQNAVSSEEGLGPLWDTRRAYWNDRVAYEDQVIDAFLSFEVTKQLHLGSSPNPERFVESVRAEHYAGAPGRKVSLTWAPGKIIGGEDYLLQLTVPNTYFHLTMAYAILRHNGVDVEKRDFLGPLGFVEI